MITVKNLSPHMSFNDWCIYWLETTSYSRGLTSNAKYEEIILHVIKPAFTGKILSCIEFQDVQNFIGSLKIKGLKASRILMIRTIFNMLMESAVNHNLINRNPAALAHSDKKLRKEIKILNDDDVKKLLELKNESVYVRALLFTLSLGLRIGETLGLSWNNIDLEKESVTISQQLTAYYQAGKTHNTLLPYTKTRKDRVLPLPEIAIEILRLQKKFYVENPDRLVFTEDNGNAIIYAAFYYQFNKLMNQIGRSDITPHGLRHTAATTLLYGTRDILLVKEMLGHSSTDTTVRYPTVTLQERQETADAIDDYFADYLGEMMTCS